jgi:regulatory protein
MTIDQFCGSEMDDVLGHAAFGPTEAHEDPGYRRAFERAVRLLAQREHSVRELTEKLRGKGIDAAMASLVVDDLRGRGMQSDSRFAEAFVHSRIGRAQGPIRIREELRQRGIDDELAEEMLTESGEYWLELAKATREKKFGAAAPGDRDEWSRQARFLARRGFPADLVYRVLNGAGDHRGGHGSARDSDDDPESA